MLVDIQISNTRSAAVRAFLLCPSHSSSLQFPSFLLMVYFSSHLMFSCFFSSHLFLFAILSLIFTSVLFILWCPPSLLPFSFFSFTFQSLSSNLCFVLFFNTLESCFALHATPFLSLYYLLLPTSSILSLLLSSHQYFWFPYLLNNERWRDGQNHIDVCVCFFKGSRL